MKKIISCVMVAVLTMIAVNYVGELVDPEWTYDAMNAIEAFHNEEPDSLDVIIYGSSHAWKGCDTRVMRDEFGLSAYNYGCNWQTANTTLLFLQDSLRTQTPRVVCIEAYLLALMENHTDLNGQIYYTRAIRWFPGKWDYLKQCFGKDIGRWISYYIPLTMFHENWTHIYSENFAEWPPAEWYTSTRGYAPSELVQAINIPDYKDFPQAELSGNALATLNKMVQACKEKNISIVFYKTPYAGEYSYSSAMKMFVSQYDNCVYLDLYENLEETGLDGATDFRDGGHLNDSGAAKVARYLGRYITENYEFIISEEFGK